jgi:hypothetical protein
MSRVRFLVSMFCLGVCFSGDTRGYEWNYRAYDKLSDNRN